MVSLPFTGRFSRRRANAFTPVNVLLSSAFQGIADILFQPVILLTVIALTAGASPRQIAVLATAVGSSWGIAPFIIGMFGQLRVSVYVITITAGAVRLLMALAMFLLAGRFDSTNADSWLRQLIVVTVVYHAANALTSQATTPMIAHAVSGPMRLRIFRVRRLTSLAASLGSAVVAWSVLRADAMTLDLAADRLLVLGAIAVAAATWFLVSVPSRGHVPDFGGHNRADAGLSGVWSRRPLRRYLVFRWILAIATAGDVFLIVYGIRELDLPLASVGEALVWFAVGSVGGNVLWTAWARTFGSRAPLQISALLHVLILLVAVVIPTLVTTELYTDRFDSLDPARRVYAALFGVLGLAISALAVANVRYLRDVTSTSELASAVKLTNASMAVLGLAPLGVALLLDRFSLDRILIGLAVAAFVALLASGLLTESRSGFRQRA